MRREVDLVSYLPPFMQKYREPVAALKAEDPEFAALWEAADRILHNRFISTADEWGIDRFERLLGIVPLEGDTLEMRRIRLQNRWHNRAIYTVRALGTKLSELLGGEHRFALFPEFEEGYKLLLVVYSADDGLYKELRYLLDVMIPLNIGTDIVFENVTSSLAVRCGATMEQADILEIKQR